MHAPVIDPWGSPWRRFLSVVLEPCVERWHSLGDFFPWGAVQVTLDPALGRALSTLTTQLHWCNYQIWHHEDLCRSGDPEKIVPNKQAIDKLNQQRNDLMERVDENIAASPAQDDCPYNSEGLGPIVDRASITMLKLYHTMELIGQGRQGLQERMDTLQQQLDFLIDQADSLFGDVRAGRRRIMVFRQLKMYNSDLNKHWRSNNGQSD